jgi:signal transduction histidine kinase
VAREADKIIVEIQDQGRGMSPEKLAKIQSRGSGVGSVECESACVTFSGELLLESNGKGTKIVATLPSKAFPAEEQVVVGEDAKSRDPLEKS